MVLCKQSAIIRQQQCAVAGPGIFTSVTAVPLQSNSVRLHNNTQRAPSQNSQQSGLLSVQRWPVPAGGGEMSIRLMTV